MRSSQKRYLNLLKSYNYYYTQDITSEIAQKQIKIAGHIYKGILALNGLAGIGCSNYMAQTVNSIHQRITGNELVKEKTFFYNGLRLIAAASFFFLLKKPSIPVSRYFATKFIRI